MSSKTAAPAVKKTAAKKTAAKKGEKVAYAKKVENHKKAVFVTKEIGGEKNGGKRTVRINRQPRYYPTEDRPRKLRNRHKPFSQHKRNLRSSITPGTVLILVAGRHKGKRVVCLKQLGTGLLLVTGPYCLNGCPLRRVNQIYVIATKTKVDISGVKLPERLNDDYFRRKKFRKPKQREGDIFDTKKETYSVSDERKEDQISVDKQLLEAVSKHPDKSLMIKYLRNMFKLGRKQYPHEMIF